MLREQNTQMSPEMSTVVKRNAYPPSTELTKRDLIVYPAGAVYPTAPQLPGIRGPEVYQTLSPISNSQLAAELELAKESKRRRERLHGAAGSFRASPVLLSVMSGCVMTLLA